MASIELVGAAPRRLLRRLLQRGFAMPRRYPRQPRPRPVPMRRRLASPRSRRWRGKLPLGLAALSGLLLLVALVRFPLLLPLAVLAVVLWGLYLAWRWVDRQQARATDRDTAQQDRLNRAFYDLVQRHNGRISVLDFAMATHLEAAAARAFLDAKAQDFFADFEPTDTGDVIYRFTSLGTGPSTPS